MSGTEHETKTASEKRKGRVFKAIMYGLSWTASVPVQVPAALWTKLKDGATCGPCIKSMRGINDPDQGVAAYRGVTWSAWLFAGVFGPDKIYIQSSAMAATDFLDLADIAAEAKANPGDSPTDGI